jgi:hypothetical protein
MIAIVWIAILRNPNLRVLGEKARRAAAQPGRTFTEISRVDRGEYTEKGLNFTISRPIFSSTSTNVVGSAINESVLAVISAQRLKNTFFMDPVENAIDEEGEVVFYNVTEVDPST